MQHSEPSAPSADPDFASFPLAAKGRKYQDFTVGQQLVHHWGRTLTAADASAFSTATCAWLPIHLNVEYAREHGHPDVVVNPMLVLCTVVGLSVEDLSEAGGPFLGIDNCVFQLPVHPGDTVVARSEVLCKRPSSTRPGVGIVSWRTEAHNQHGRLVLELERTNLVAMRAGTTDEEG